MADRMTTQEFIERAREVHGDCYDYSKVMYVNTKTKVCVVCPEHGEFWQRAESHLNGMGCKMCGRKKCALSKTKWTKESCRAEALKYTDIKSFAEQSSVAYNIALRNGWFAEYHWLERKKTPNGTWSKENTEHEARKYHTRKDFKEGSYGAYQAAVLNGWLEGYTWFPIPRNAKKWNRTSCFEEAKKYRSRTEFREHSIIAYSKARDNHWIDDYTWFVDPISLWDCESCKEEALKYRYKNDFRYQAYFAYRAACLNDWLKDYDWLIEERNIAPNTKWNYETCYSEAKKYKTKSEFGKYGKGAYDVARRNGWLTDYTWFPDFKDSDALVDSVYRYYFKLQNTIYVGRTLMYRQHKRDLEHRSMADDAVLKFARKHQCEVPPMEIIEQELTIQEGCEREDYWRMYYFNAGYNVLNKAATGVNSSSVGALGIGKWTFEKAYEIARQFETVNEMCKEYEYVYRLAKVKGWAEQFTWFRGDEIKREKTTKWTEEICMEEAKKYSSWAEFRKYKRSLYDKAARCGWLEQYTWMKHNRHVDWDYDKCKDEAAMFCSRSEFCKKSYAAYRFCSKNGWLDDFFPKKNKGI